MKFKGDSYGVRSPCPGIEISISLLRGAGYDAPERSRKVVLLVSGYSWHFESPSQPDYPKLMSTTSLLRQAANKVYQRAFPIYRPLYAAYKTYADRAERELLRKILFQGAVVADVGANIGIYSQFLSRCVGPTGLVHSFEPSPDNFRRLSAATRDLSKRPTHSSCSWRAERRVQALRFRQAKCRS